ncbi:PREDICTED: insulin-like growth factor II isoform X2 [Papilio xuthus]|uniref:Insulin-like growth factor II isoform X2 n=1 Tax=Papilio xuthus TaxID=66420 RepID=A0AAJ6ZLD3_PAPXU|nr:PREDICTED: insulin-like growth factor II isoform X2 [Papilio xuthus]
MLLRRVVTALLAVAAGAALCGRADAASVAMKLCGRKLGEILSRVCSAYNSPAWDVPTVVEQTAGVVRRRRETGIVYECCTQGCTLEHLTEYCATTIKATSETSVDSHMIEDRSAESTGSGSTGAAGAAGMATAARAPAAQHIIKSAARAAPVVGTVSPLLTWGRTLNTDLPTVDNDRYAYVIYA